MGGSWKIGQVAGIGIFVHWTFLLLIAFFLFLDTSSGKTLAAAVENIVFIIAIFGCITLHELGHALMAKRYGVTTRDITLLPIGGVARLERIPENPVQEFWIAIAGPMVNVVIAGALIAFLALTNSSFQAIEERTFDENLMAGNFLVRLATINIFLVVFNLLPAFPMDGGRVLRAILAHFSGDYVGATRTAAMVGQGMAILFAMVGLFGGAPMLLFIALFVYLGAQGEAHQVQTQAVLRGVPVRAAMMTRTRALQPADTLQTAVDELLAGAQQDFPIVDGGRVVGLLMRADVLRALAEGGREQLVRDVMRNACGVVEDSEMLDATFQRMSEQGCNTVAVTRGGQYVGLVTLENIGELMMVFSALRQSNAQAAAART